MGVFDIDRETIGIRHRTIERAANESAPVVSHHG
jgi:DNA integrity scanning protein DisA with diadenylate cyclase activity